MECGIEVCHTSLHGRPYWLMDGDPNKPVCDRHKQQYDTAYDDYSDIKWTRVELTEQEKAEKMYPKHHPETALANYRAGREVWDSNGDVW